MPKQFQFCPVCRRNHDQGRGHRYSAKHKQSLDSLLGKMREKIEGVRHFVKNVVPLRDQAQDSSKFWCSFCEQDISEQQSLFMRAQAIEHLGSHMHADNVKSFWAENGGNAEKHDIYVIEDTELAKWEEVCKAVSAVESKDREQPTQMLNNVQSNQNTNELLPRAGENKSSLPFMSSVAGLTVIRVPLLKPGEGNVHSGAAPPWLNRNGGAGQGQLASPTSSPSHLLPLSRTQERKLAKIRNPDRVGAAWAEMRRAELEREKRGKFVAKPSDGSSWFPSFGRVWQSGSRRDTRKEFEAEKQLESRKQGRRGVGQGRKRMTSRSVGVQPYISKRQRMTMDAHHE